VIDSDDLEEARSIPAPEPAGLDDYAEVERKVSAVERIFPGSRIIRSDGAAFMEKPMTNMEPMTKCLETPCTACGRRSWWRSSHGQVVCGGCHPPASAEVVAKWLGHHDA
jgi:hypothetical protein